MIKKYIFTFFILLFTTVFQAQVTLSSRSEVSIITAGPGNVLFEAFGHSAIRIQDPILKIDNIYNYGLFNFNAPNFYTNFTKGRLLYSLGKQNFNRFAYSYQRQKRWLKEQVLNLTLEEKQAYFNFLEENSLPENAEYLYDPYFNNCATKLRDITKSILGPRVTFNNNHLENGQSFRELMNKEIPWNTWGSFGINLALGSKLDKIASSDQYMYLPDYVFYTFKNATRFIKNQPEKLVKREVSILKFKEIKQKISVLNPLLIFSLISFIGLFITYKDFKKSKRNKWLDFTLFFFTGIIGVLIVFLWFFTNHSTTPNNFNFLWAFSPNIFVAFLLLKSTIREWLIKYVYVLLSFLVLIPIIWLTKIQQLPFSIVPVLILLFFRYLFLIKKGLLTSKK